MRSLEIGNSQRQFINPIMPAVKRELLTGSRANGVGAKFRFDLADFSA
jgi:hypothetical protein